MIGETIDAEYASDFSVAKVFSDDMVVQRNEHIRVWGFAPESENGKKVSATFKGMFAEAIIENGEWCITFGSRLIEDVNGAQMKIYTDKKTVTFDNVLVGDVYLVMGQSNTNYTVSNHFAYDNPATQGGGEAAIDPDSIIRINRLSGQDAAYDKFGSDYVYSDLMGTVAWSKTTQDETLNFSAIGYYFARQLTEKNPTVPVGMIQISKGGAPIVSFLPNDLAEKWDADYYNPETGKYYSYVSNEHMGRYFYNCYLAPISKYALAGVVWYQGESNNSLSEAMNYNETFADFITRLRSTHNVTNKDFPVFVTELPSIYNKPADYTGTWYYMELGVIRSYMGSIPTVLNNSYVAASSDIWNNKTFANNLHPNCKYEQAERLAAIADVVVHNNGSLDSATGPIYNYSTISEDKKTIVITFSNVGDGLATADGGDDVLGIVGFRDEKFGQVSVSPTSAVITAPDQITVTFDTEIKAVAYNYISNDYYGETINLCNSFGCSATAFITPYTEKELDQYAAADFKPTNDSSLGFKSWAFDSLAKDGINIFEPGKVTSGLTASGGRIDVPKGTRRVTATGWAGFTDHEIIAFGYSIDGGNAIFKGYPSAATNAIINAGGQYAKRYTINIDTSSLSYGDHEVYLMVLADIDGGVAVKLYKIIINITGEFKSEDFRSTSDSSVNFKNMAIDSLKVDDVRIFQDGNVSAGLKAQGYRVSVPIGTKKLSTSGWAGFTGHDILLFGYAFDNGNAVFNAKTYSAGSSVIAAGGEHAKRYEFHIDISDLEVGDHTVYLMALVDVDGGVAVKMFGFTLTIVDEYTNADFQPTVGGPVTTKGLRIDSITAENGIRNDYTITISKGTSQVKASGWLGFDNVEIVMLGYNIDGGNGIFKTYPSSAETGVQNAAGPLAKRFDIVIDTSNLAVGDHPVYLLALVDADERVAIKLIKITITVTE